MAGPLRALALSCALLGFACGAGSVARDEGHERAVHTLRFASPYSSLHPFSRADQAWIDWIEAASQRRLRVVPFWSGALLSADHSVIELRHGVADVAVISPIYARGGAHVLRAQAGFYAGANGFWQQVAVYRCLEREFAALGAELAGVEVLAVQGGNLPGIVTRSRPARDMASLAGLRLRAPAELIDVLSALGADPVNLPMSDVYSALAKGVIDGVVVAPDALRALHLAEVGRYYATVAIPRGAYPARAISRRALRRLPLDLQQLVRQSSATWESALDAELRAALVNGERHGREQGITFITWAADEQARFRSAYNRAARRAAKALSRHGVDGDALFARAQHWTTQLAGAADARVSMPCL